MPFDVHSDWRSDVHSDGRGDWRSDGRGDWRSDVHSDGCGDGHSRREFDCDVAIVGAGPVGLFAGVMLAQRGIRVRVLEAKATPSQHSRAIGVHPPALERLAHLGLADAFCQRGVKVQEGVALTYAGKHLGTLDFGRCPAPYNFVLAIRQDDNEAILRDALRREDAQALCWDARVTGVHQDDTQDDMGVQLEVNSGATQRTLRARYVLACDGKRSFVRQALAIAFHGRPYPHRYMMGDFADNTDLGHRAAILLTKQGLVESFPLPGGVRRWVMQRHSPSHASSHAPDAPGHAYGAPDHAYDALQVPHHTDTDDDITPADLVACVRQRSGYQPDVNTNSMFSTFGVERYIAGRFVLGRVVLLGDAAHVISPIGGQGMNVGWLGAWQAVGVLEPALTCHTAPNWHLYERQQRNRANQAAARAEFNMAATQVSSWLAVRNALVWLALHTPIRDVAARTFSMRGL